MRIDAISRPRSAPTRSSCRRGERITDRASLSPCRGRVALSSCRGRRGRAGRRLRHPCRSVGVLTSPSPGLTLPESLRLVLAGRQSRRRPCIPAPGACRVPCPVLRSGLLARCLGSLRALLGSSGLVASGRPRPLDVLLAFRLARSSRPSASAFSSFSAFLRSLLGSLRRPLFGHLAAAARSRTTASAAGLRTDRRCSELVDSGVVTSTTVAVVVDGATGGVSGAASSDGGGFLVGRGVDGALSPSSVPDAPVAGAVDADGGPAAAEDDRVAASTVVDHAGSGARLVPGGR